MPDRRFLKPARPGLIVRDPEHGGARMSAQGAWCNWSVHWARRVADGDVVEAQAPPEDQAPPEAARAQESE